VAAIVLRISLGVVDMGRSVLCCVFSLFLSTVFAAQAPSGTYAQKLLIDLAKANPQLLAAAISATPPKSSDSIVIASTDPSVIGAKPDPADVTVAGTGKIAVVASAVPGRLDVHLPLHDVSGDTIGALTLSYPNQAGADRAALEQSAERIRDALHRRISHAGNLFDPYPYDPEVATNTYAQKLVDEFMDKYPEIEIFAIHATPPDSDYNVIAGSNIGRIGKKADNDDMRCVFTGKPNLEINSTGKRFESEMQLHDRAGRVIGAVGIVVAYKKGDDRQALHAHAEQIRAELEKRIADSSSLFRPAS